MRPGHNLSALFAGLFRAFQTRETRLLLALTGSFILGASLFFHLVEGWRFLDATYFSVMTIATVGYGDFVPQTDAGKIFAIIYVVTGIGLFVATATSIANAVIRQRADLDDEIDPGNMGEGN